MGADRVRHCGDEFTAMAPESLLNPGGTGAVPSGGVPRRGQSSVNSIDRLCAALHPQGRTLCLSPQRDDPVEPALVVQERLFTKEENPVYHAARRAWRTGQGVPRLGGSRTAGKEKERCRDRNRQGSHSWKSAAWLTSLQMPRF